MPFEVWYIPFFRMGIDNTCFRGEAEGYCINRGLAKPFKIDKSGATPQQGEAITRVVVDKKGVLRNYDSPTTKLVIMGHCDEELPYIHSDSVKAQGNQKINAIDLVKLLYDEEGIRNIRNIQVFACHAASGGKWSFIADFGKRMAAKLESLQKVSGYTEKLDRLGLQFGSKIAKGNRPAKELKVSYDRNQLLEL